jgi:DNA-binding GntR family transcriptional regulator
MVGATDNERPEALLAYAERRIKTAIADGSITPGSRLSPTLLAADFGISHIPVREALTYLNATGYVDHKHRSGFFARQLSSADLADIYHWRELLETEAYRMSVPTFTADDVAELTRRAKAVGRKTRSRDRLEFIRLNRDFHFLPFELTGSERLLRFLNYLWDVAEPYMNAELTESSRSHDDHMSMIPLFDAHDVEGVIEAMNRHRGRRVKHISEWEAAHPALTKATKANGRTARTAPGATS